MRLPCLLLTQAFFGLSCLILPWHTNAQALKVYTQVWPPYNYEQDGKLTGYSTELLQAVLQEAGVEASYKTLSWGQAYQNASTQANALIYTTTRMPDREALFEWIGPIGTRKLLVFKLKERQDIQIKRKEDLKKYRISIVRESLTMKWVIDQQLFPRDQIDEAPTTASNVKKLFFKRVDLILATKGGANYELSQLPYPKEAMEAVYVLNDEFQFYFAINKKSDPALIDKIRLAFEKIKATGLIETLKKKYMVD